MAKANARHERTRIRGSEFVDQVRGRLVEQGTHNEDGLADMEVVVALQRLSMRMTNDFEAVHRPFGCSWAGFRIMVVLWTTGPLEPSEIARLSVASRASISSVINTLEDAGFVERRRDSSDRRAVLVSLTDKGLRSMREQSVVQARRERAWLRVLTSDERDTFHKILRRLADQATPDAEELDETRSAAARKNSGRPHTRRVSSSR